MGQQELPKSQTLEKPSDLRSPKPQDDGSDPLRFALPSVLQVAMGSLDVDLDEELARYRRQLAALDHERTLASSSAGIVCDDESLAIAPYTASDALANVNSDNSDLVIATQLEAPVDYLESSEALLRSLSEPDDEAQALSAPSDSESANTGLFATLITPLGIGSLALLVLSSATLGYVIINPSVLGFRGDRPGDAMGVFGDTPQSSTKIAPDLSSGEFSELNLSTLSSIPSQRRTSILGDGSDLGDESDELGSEAANGDPALEPSQIQPVPASNTAIASAAAVQPQISHTVPTQTTVQQSSPPNSSASSALPALEPAPSVSTAPSTNPSASLPVASATAAPSADGYIYVVTPYTGDRSLTQAQEVVSGAYVRNFPQGAQVQLGAFSTPERAQTLVQELNSQGIPAQLYAR